MKALNFISLFIFTFSIWSCGPSEKEKAEAQRIREQDSIAAVLANLAAIEARKPPILKEFEIVKKSGGKVILYDFVRKKCVSDRIKESYGNNFYDFIVSYLQKNNSPSSIMGENEPGNNDRWFINAILDSDNYYQFMLSYNLLDDVLKASMSINGNNINADGTFALIEGSQWKGKYLEFDKFGDPIKDKVFVAVSNSDDNYQNSAQIAVMKGDESHVRFYYDLPFHPAYFDNNKLRSIELKNKQDDSIRKLTGYKYDTKHCILSEEDSRYLMDLCNSDSHVSFSIRFVVLNYDWFPDSSDAEAVVIDFDNGLAYGLSNAINAYFYRAF